MPLLLTKYGSMPVFFAGFSGTGAPLFYGPFNAVAGQSINTPAIWPGGIAGIGLTGKIDTGLLGMWDMGEVSAPGISWSYSPR